MRRKSAMGRLPMVSTDTDGSALFGVVIDKGVRQSSDVLIRGDGGIAQQYPVDAWLSYGIDHRLDGPPLINILRPFCQLHNISRLQEPRERPRSSPGIRHSRDNVEPACNDSSCNAAWEEFWVTDLPLSKRAIARYTCLHGQDDCTRSKHYILLLGRVDETSVSRV